MTGLEIVAVGARTPVGLAAETNAAAVRAGIRRIAEFPFVTANGELMKVAADARISPAVLGPERLVTLAGSALAEVLAQIPKPPRLIDLRLALPEARPGLSDRNIATVIETLTTLVRTPDRQVRVECSGRGHASVAAAIAQTRPDDEILTLVLGVDSYLHPDTFIWLEADRRFGPTARSGMIPGEAAGCLALASPRLRKRLGMPRLAAIAGAATAHEQFLPGSETGSLGAGMTQAVLAAFAGHQLPRDAADAVYVDVNGERYRSEEWAFVALRAHEAIRAAHHDVPATCWGDVGAASGALAGMLAVQAWTRGYAAGPRALLVNGSPHGLRGAVLLHFEGATP